MDALAMPEEVMKSEESARNEQSTEGAASSSKFQQAVTSWRNVGLAELIAQLDSTATGVVDHQKDAVLERKEVAQKTKDFRKLDDTEKLSEYKGLLKAYQGFVDLLTVHNKEASSAFLQLYTAVSEAPDPFPLLEASLEAFSVSEETVPRLKQENVEQERQITRLTKEVESVEDKLRSERTIRKDLESKSSDRITEIESSWKEVLNEKESNWLEQQKGLEEKIENQDRLLKELKANYEVSRRLGQDDEDNAARKAASAELQMTVSELEKTSARLAEAQARNEQLRIELVQMSTRAATDPENDSQILRLQSENSSLLRRIEGAKSERESAARRAEDRVAQLERQRKFALEESHALKAKMQKQADYDNIKRELEMIRSVELNISIDDDDSAGFVPTAATKVTEESLEKLLVARNKKLNDDLVSTRVAHKELIEQVDGLKAELFRTSQDLQKSQKLSSQLENDLLNLQNEAPSGLPSSAMSVAGTYTSRHPGSMRRGRASPTSSIISGFDGQSRGSGGFDPMRGEPMGGGSGILPMVQAQRDRFKQKTAQLEDELQKSYATVTSLRQEVASLQKDNLNLYERSRYVSAYNRNTGAAASSGGHRDTSHTIDVDDAVTTNKWKSQYEANISPFAAFRGREATRAYNRMSLPERLVFSATKIVLATRTSRNLFAGYCLALHILVLAMLFSMSTTSVVVNPLDVAGFGDGAKQRLQNEFG